MECKIKDVSINYEIVGSGKAIVMIHGFYVDHKIMAGCMEPIFTNDGYKRIYFDLPGMGKSGAPEWITSTDQMLDIVIEFIETILPNEKFLLAGQSYGGYLARGVVNKMADRIAGVLLICPVVKAENKERSVEEHVVLVKDDELLSMLTPEEAEDFSSGCVVQSKRIYDRNKSEILSGVEMADGAFLQNIREMGYALSCEDTMNRKFEKPTLMLLGKQDNCVGYKDAWNILEDFPRATFAVLDRAGHCLQLEQENLFVSLINDWLERASSEYTWEN